MEGSRENKIDDKKAAKIFDLMANFAEYGFNKSHSAAYALIAFQTAYLKANFPVEFMAALLTNEVNNQDKIVRFISECREKDLVVLPPDINQSGINFSVVDGRIRFGMAGHQGRGPGGHRIHSGSAPGKALYRSVRILRDGSICGGSTGGSSRP